MGAARRPVDKRLCGLTALEFARVGMRTVPIDRIALKEMIVQRLGARRRLGVEIPLRKVLLLGADQLRVHLVQAQPALCGFGVDERDHRLVHHRRCNELAHTIT